MTLYVGKRLMTRDGRRIGNGTIYEIDTEAEPFLYCVETDFGNKTKFTLGELVNYYHLDFEPDPEPHTYERWLSDRRGKLGFMDAVEGFRWIDKQAVVRGEDFAYRATVLCSFPKLSGKVRYVVEDNGRIFIQRESQIEWIDEWAMRPTAVADVKTVDGEEREVELQKTGREDELKALEAALNEWMSTAEETCRTTTSDGVPSMGKFETENLYRKARDYFKVEGVAGGCPHCGHRHPPDGMCV